MAQTCKDCDFNLHECTVPRQPVRRVASPLYIFYFYGGIGTKLYFILHHSVLFIISILCRNFMCYLYKLLSDTTYVNVRKFIKKIVDVLSLLLSFSNDLIVKNGGYSPSLDLGGFIIAIIYTFILYA